MIVAVAVVACGNSFEGVFIFDDITSIVDNPHIRTLWPIWDAMKAPPQQTVAGRPMLSLSLAVNYAISELDVWSYHAVNLTIHILAALLLFGVIRRTLLTHRLTDTFARHSALLAGICWTIVTVAFC